MNVALELFHDLCQVGNGLAAYRDRYALCSDDWATLTCLVLALDSAIARLVHSQGLDGEDD